MEGKQYYKKYIGLIVVALCLYALLVLYPISIMALVLEIYLFIVAFIIISDTFKYSRQKEPKEVKEARIKAEEQALKKMMEDIYHTKE